MISEEQKKAVLESMIKLLELPDSAYEKAANRYEDLGDWFDRDDSQVKDNDPHIFPQGSFRLGTAIRPLDNTEEYDLDLACKLRDGVTKSSHTQESLKNLIGRELELYRVARHIKEELIEKHRCWRLEYQDDLSFHMDIVPCIPADESRRQIVMKSMRVFGIDESFVRPVSQTTVYITDDRHEKYETICDDWNISNPEGYALWFEDRMNSIRNQTFSEKAQVDDLPVFKRKTPLQQSVQLLKRHRDRMFKDYEDVKPVSIIITTLAARAYNGEQDILSALYSILAKMESLINPNKPKVPNPVDPDEDFADRWDMPEYKHLNLEKNFRHWIQQAKSDFDLITSAADGEFIAGQGERKFSLKLNKTELSKKLGLSVVAPSIIIPKAHAISEDPPKPWKADD